MPSSKPASDSGRNNEQTRRNYWRANLRLIAVLLSIWAVVSYGCGILFVEWLNQFAIGRLPVGYWFANQGSMYIFVALIFIYARRMKRLDRQYGVED
jgi:putative solute:sodium symporter small subunit